MYNRGIWQYWYCMPQIQIVYDRLHSSAHIDLFGDYIKWMLSLKNTFPQKNVWTWISTFRHDPVEENLRKRKDYVHLIYWQNYMLSLFNVSLKAVLSFIKREKGRMYPLRCGLSGNRREPLVEDAKHSIVFVCVNIRMLA